MKYLANKMMTRFGFDFLTEFIERTANSETIFVHVFCRCESGTIEQECTSTSDTVCKMKGTIIRLGMVQHPLYFERLLKL